VTPGIQELIRQVEGIRDSYRRHVLAGDLDAAVALTAPEVSVLRLPARTGATGQDALRRHLSDDVTGRLPADLAHSRLSRTTDRFRVVDEERVAFTHDRELPWLLPGAASTGRSAEVVVITVVTVRQARITAVRALWDQTGLLAQLDLPADAVRPGAAVGGAVEGPASWW
jgi:carboxymethylenebutenolidase